MAKFLIIHPINLDVYGGGERVCQYVIKALLAHGQQVELLTFDFDRSRYKEVMGDEFPNIKVHTLGKRLEVKPPFTIYKRRQNVVKLLKQFKQTVNSKYDYNFLTQWFSGFEGTYLSKTEKNIAYVHFPEIHYLYDHSGFRRKAYLWLYRWWLNKGIGKLNLIFCNSQYTKGIIERYWNKYGIPEPIVVYPPVDIESFRSDKPLRERAKRVVYVGRFVGAKRHDLLKKLAIDLPQFEFVSVGGLKDSEENWFEDFSKNLPSNYVLKPNLPRAELIKLLQESGVYFHAMEGEHFGIAPVEALASGCVTIVHNSGGSSEFIPIEFRWDNYDDLKQKIVKWLDPPDQSDAWEKTREELWAKISVLEPKNFEENLWSQVHAFMQKTESSNIK